MPPLSGVCGGCGRRFEDVTFHQTVRGCYPPTLTATEAWKALTAATRSAAPRAERDRHYQTFAAALARYT